MVNTVIGIVMLSLAATTFIAHTLSYFGLCDIEQDKSSVRFSAMLWSFNCMLWVMMATWPN
jgi:hypothetical protein